MKELISIVAAVTIWLSPASEVTEIGETAGSIAHETVESVFLIQPALSSLDIDEGSGEASDETNEEVSDSSPFAIDEAREETEATALAIEETEPSYNTDEMAFLGTYKLTAYCPCKKCTGKSPSSPGYNMTASGTQAQNDYTVAMRGIAFGTKIYIEGLGMRVVEDRGVGSGVIDIYCSTHEACFNPEYNRNAKVWIIE